MKGTLPSPLRPRDLGQGTQAQPWDPSAAQRGDARAKGWSGGGRGWGWESRRPWSWGIWSVSSCLEHCRSWAQPTADRLT